MNSIKSVSNRCTGVPPIGTMLMAVWLQLNAGHSLKFSYTRPHPHWKSVALLKSYLFYLTFVVAQGKSM